MIHLLQDGGLEEHQMEALFEEIKEVGWICYLSVVCERMRVFVSVCAVSLLKQLV